MAWKCRIEQVLIDGLAAPQDRREISFAMKQAATIEEATVGPGACWPMGPRDEPEDDKR